MAISVIETSHSKEEEQPIAIMEDVFKHLTFGKSTTNDRGYYIIHPEWTSETAGQKKSYR